MTGIPVLQNTVCIPILIYLLDNDGATKSRVYSDVSHTGTTADRIEDLAECGLVELERTGLNGRATAIWLTDEGREVARRLKEISELVSDAGRKASDGTL